MNNWKIAFRQLAKNPGFTVVTVLTLAVGMALVACAFATVNAYLIQSLPYPSADRIFHVRYAPVGPYEPRGMSAIEWKDLGDVVEDVVKSSSANIYLMEGGSVKTTRTLQASPGFMRGLGVQAARGRTFAEDEFAPGAARVAMISHEMWRTRFGSDPQIVGKEFEVSLEETGRTNGMIRVVGVLEPGFWFGRDSSATVDILMPSQARLNVSQAYLIRLRPGVPAAYAEKRLTEAARKVGSDFREGWTGVHLQSMKDRYVESIRPILIGVTVATGVVLVLACANVAVLALLRALRRQKETAVRIALGASQGQLARLLAAETLLLCGAALVAGILLSQAGLQFLTPMIEQQLGKTAPGVPSQIQIDGVTLATIGGLSLLIAMSLAFIPLLMPWSRRLTDALRSQGTVAMEGPSMRRLRGTLIGFEIAGSLVLLAGCGLMIRSTLNLTNTNLGFNPEQAFRVGVRLPARTYADPQALDRFYRALVAKLPETENAKLTLMSAGPSFYPANKHRFEVSDSPGEQNPAGLVRVGADYFKMYEVPVKQGREFSLSDSLESEPVAMVSHTLAAKLWPQGDIVGRRIRLAEGDGPDSPLLQWRTVVGVVGDIRQDYDDSDLRDIYVPFLQSPTRFSSFHVRSQQAPAFWQQRIRAAAAEVDPYAQVGQVILIRSEDQRRGRTEFLASMLTGFAVFAALLAALGIYGVTRYSAQQREREIAIHVALGATRRAVVAMFMKDGVRMLAIGIIVGVLGALGAAKVLQSMVYGVEPHDAATIVVVCLVLIFSGLTAMWLPARRAAARDPMTVLKEG